MPLQKWEMKKGPEDILLKYTFPIILLFSLQGILVFSYVWIWAAAKNSRRGAGYCEILLRGAGVKYSNYTLLLLKQWQILAKDSAGMPGRACVLWWSEPQSYRWYDVFHGKETSSLLHWRRIKELGNFLLNSIVCLWNSRQFGALCRNSILLGWTIVI